MILEINRYIATVSIDFVKYCKKAILPNKLIY